MRVGAWGCGQDLPAFSLLFSKQPVLGGRAPHSSGVFVAFEELKNAVFLIHGRCGSLIGSRAPNSRNVSKPTQTFVVNDRSGGSPAGARRNSGAPSRKQRERERRTEIGTRREQLLGLALTFSGAPLLSGDPLRKRRKKASTPLSGDPVSHLRHPRSGTLQNPGRGCSSAAVVSQPRQQKMFVVLTKLFM